MSQVQRPFLLQFRRAAQRRRRPGVPVLRSALPARCSEVAGREAGKAVKRAELQATPAPSLLDLTHHRAPIYVQLATLFRRFIVTGQWPIDKQIPTHEDIAAQFDVN